MIRMVLLPLDSRPCTYDFPQRLVPEKLCELCVPPFALMDFYRTSSEYDRLEQWLLENCTDANVLVLSVEQLLHGGLLASRNNSIPEETCHERLSLIKRLKQRNPSLKIYLFSIIMRATVSTLSAESQRWWELVAQYSHAAYLAQQAPDTTNIEAVETLTAQIPPSVLVEYNAVRRRNHGINKACVQLVAQDIADYLLLLQEDCAPQSLQVLEQHALKQLAAVNGLSDRIDLHNGTDEAASELCVKVLLQGEEIPLRTLWLGGNHDFTARYEDRPFKENLNSHLRMMRFYDDQKADLVLAILPPKHNQFDNCPPSYNPTLDYTETEYEAMAAHLQELDQQDKRCYLLDLTHANGGNLPFLRYLNERLPVMKLDGYSAWNTASNALGTILAQIGSDHLRGDRSSKRSLQERLLDDLLYQSLIRQQFQKALELNSEDIWNIRQPDKAQTMLEECFHQSRPLIEELMGPDISFSAKLRWPRIFEIDIEPDAVCTSMKTESGKGATDDQDI